MARIRTIKPEMWKHEQLGRCSVLARLTFVGLISLSDDEGRGVADPEQLWGSLHPYQGSGPKALWKRALSELKAIKDKDGPLVIFYKVAGASYYWLPGFCRQQYIEKPYRSKLPPPPNSGNDHQPIQNHSALERRGEERIRDQGEDQGSGRGEELPFPTPLASPLPLEGSTEAHSPVGGEPAEIEQTIASFGGWRHPSPDKKAEAITEMRDLGLSHEYIRSASQLNKPADVGFWDIVKSLKAAHGSRRNGRTAKLPDSNGGMEHNIPTEKPPVLRGSREADLKRQDEARAKCDQMLEAMGATERDQFFADAEAAADAGKLKPGPMRESFIKAEVRRLVAKQYAIEGL